MVIEYQGAMSWWFEYKLKMQVQEIQLIALPDFFNKKKEIIKKQSSKILNLEYLSNCSHRHPFGQRSVNYPASKIGRESHYKPCQYTK